MWPSPRTMDLISSLWALKGTVKRIALMVAILAKKRDKKDLGYGSTFVYFGASKESNEKLTQQMNFKIEN